MDTKVEQLKGVVREVLGDGPSELFYQRVDRALEAAAGEERAMKVACRKVQSMVHLFIDIAKAGEIGRRFARIYGPEATNGVGMDAVKRLDHGVVEAPTRPKKKGWLF